MIIQFYTPSGVIEAEPTLQNVGPRRMIVFMEQLQTARLQREAANGSTVVNPETGRTASQQLAWIDAQIVELRKLL